MPEPGRTLAEMTPTRLVQDVDVPVVETDLMATLLEYRYGRSTSGGESAWASIRLAGPVGSEDVRWPVGQKGEALGHRFYVAGSRSEVMLYTLEQLPAPTTG